MTLPYLWRLLEPLVQYLLSPGLSVITNIPYFNWLHFHTIYWSFLYRIDWRMCASAWCCNWAYFWHVSILLYGNSTIVSPRISSTEVTVIFTIRAGFCQTPKTFSQQPELSVLFERRTLMMAVWAPLTLVNTFCCWSPSVLTIWVISVYTRHNVRRDVWHVIIRLFRNESHTICLELDLGIIQIVK